MLQKSDSKGWSKEALNFLRRAKGGHADAQYEVGLRLLNGEGAPENEKTAIDWLMKSAKQGYEDAEYLLGTCYMNGRGVKENEEVALGFFLKSANAANKYAQMALGDYYFFEEKYNTAMMWYKKSAKQNHPPAIFAVGRGYYYGLCSEKSEAEGKRWFEIAASYDYKPAVDTLNKLNNDCLPPWK